MPDGLAGADRRVRLRPDRAHARPHGGGRSAPASTSQAEQARLEAYAFFEFGPERRLKAFDPALALDIEGLIWFGAQRPGGPRDADRQARAAARRSARRGSCSTTKLADAAATLGDSPNRATVVTNAAIIVFREGLEAVLILAAITASFVGARRAPAPAGADRRGRSACSSRSSRGCSPRRCCSRSQQYGEKLEAVVGLIAIGVLLLITNWFFHKVYWTEWIASFHRQRRKLLEDLEKHGVLLRAGRSACACSA